MIFFNNHEISLNIKLSKIFKYNKVLLFIRFTQYLSLHFRYPQFIFYR